jgi:hypothetical protein
MAKQTYTTGQVLTAAQMTTLQANDYNQTVSAKTASYVLVAADAGTRITMSSASTTTITVNTGVFTAGDTLIITNIGAGACTITAGTATVSTSSSLVLAQYDSGVLYFTSTGVGIWQKYMAATSAGMTNPMTTTGDTIYSSSGSTPARLGIGSTGQVLTVASGLPSWATPGGSTKSFTQLSSASVGTGTTYTVSGLSGYDMFFIQYIGISSNAAGSFSIQFNGDATSGNYVYSGLGFNQASSSAVTLQRIGNTTNTLITVVNPNDGTFTSSGGMLLYGANTSGVKIFTSVGASSGTGVTNYSLNGVYKGTSVISSITLGADGNNFDAGTLTIWGAA